MLDTNVLVSFAIFRSPTIRSVVEDAALRNELVIPTFVLDELRDVITRKWPARLTAVNRFIDAVPHQVVETPKGASDNPYGIRDPNDAPVIASAIAGGVDVLVTGDRDFEDLPLERPVIVTPSQYVERFLG